LGKILGNALENSSLFTIGLMETYRKAISRHQQNFIVTKCDLILNECEDDE